MTTFNRIHRTLALAAVGVSAVGVGHAQTWDLDACTGGTKSASGYTNCGTGNAAHGTVNIKAYTTSGAATNFSAASINNGGSYIGVLTGSETSGTGSPHHAIDNFGSPGNSYELVHLQFSKAVDLGTLVAQWANDTSTGDADFQVYRWNYNSGSAPTVTSYNPNSMTGWQLVHTGDFDSSPGTGGSGPGSLTQTISDTNYYSSHWLITTAFGGSNDAFKLGSLTAFNVCATTVTSTGGCAPGTSVPEPGTLAMVLLAGVGATAVRRRRRA